MSRVKWGLATLACLVGMYVLLAYVLLPLAWTHLWTPREMQAVF